MPYKDPNKQKAAVKQSVAKFRSKKSNLNRTRNFATVIYPDSAPKDWQDRLSKLHIPIFVSPLHNQDIIPSGEPKKPHYHVLFMFDTVKDWERQIKPLFESIGGIGREIVNSARGYARYLCHLDNPEKAQYNTSDVIAFGGADYNAVIHLPTDDIKMLQDVFKYIRVNQIYSLAELLDICAVNNPDWFAMIAMSRAYIIDKYIKSLEWERATQYERKYVVADDKVVNADTGEILT